MILCCTTTELLDSHLSVFLNVTPCQISEISILALFMRGLDDSYEV